MNNLLVRTATVIGMAIVAGTALAPVSAQATAYTFTGSGAGPVSASAVITTFAGGFTVDLTDLTTNPISIGQAISDFEITFSNAPGATTLTSQTGHLIDITTGGAFTTIAGNPTHWGVGVSGNDVTLATAGFGAPGGKPIDLIIGTATSYPAANASFGAHTPSIQGTGSFSVAALGLTDTSTVLSAMFSFGTTPDTYVAGVLNPRVAVPEPVSIVLLSTGLIGLGLIRRRRNS